jgi:hypothetical protein
MMLRAVYRRVSSSTLRACRRRYHSYPDPNEKPVITVTVSDKQRVGTTEKKVEELDKFKMTEMFPGVLMSTGISKWDAPETEATKLGNGLRVVSHEMHGQMTSVTLFVNVGSAHETQDTAGATHLSEILAFHSSKTRSRDEISTAMVFTFLHSVLLVVYLCRTCAHNLVHLGEAGRHDAMRDEPRLHHVLY